MLGKLMKYEWQGFRSPLLVLLIILAGTTAFSCSIILTVNPRYDNAVTLFSVMTFTLSILVYYFGIIGCSIGTTLIITIRFYKTCYADQGYLTHTLPVSKHRILNAKIIMAALVSMLMLIATVVSIFIIIQVGVLHASHVSPYDYEVFRRELSTEITQMFRVFQDEMGISFSLFLAYMIVYYVIAGVANIIIMLGCVSLGQLYAKHRILGAIAAYFIVQFVEYIFGCLASLPMYSRMIRGYDSTVFYFLSPTMNLTLLFTVVLAAAMYFVNLHMMTKKLNLE